MATIMQLPVDEPQIVRASAPFGDFYRREHHEVLGLAFVLSGHRPTAEELTQDAFEAAFKRWDEVGQMANPEVWVRRVVANRSVSRFRRTLAEGRAMVRIGKVARTPPVSDDSVAVWTAIRRLSRRQAEVVVLVYYVGLSHDEIAEVLGCGVETVRTHLKRAKARLHDSLRDDR